MGHAPRTAFLLELQIFIIIWKKMYIQHRSSREIQSLDEFDEIKTSKRNI